jgi:hypothetical protein
VLASLIIWTRRALRLKGGDCPREPGVAAAVDEPRGTARCAASPVVTSAAAASTATGSRQRRRARRDVRDRRGSVTGGCLERGVIDMGLPRSNSFAAPTLPYITEVLVARALAAALAEGHQRHRYNRHDILTAQGISFRSGLEGASAARGGQTGRQIALLVADMSLRLVRESQGLAATTPRTGYCGPLPSTDGATPDGSRPDGLFSALDGRELIAMGRRWTVEIFSICDQGSERWVQLALHGVTDYMLTFHLTPGNTARDLVPTLLSWLMHPTDTSEIISIA